MLLLTTFVLIVSNLVAIQAQHCILYEFHEKAVHTPRKSEIMSAGCELKGGRVTKYTSEIMDAAGPPVFNVTFHCCQNKECYTDLDCSFNFQCKLGKCKVATCDLSDSLDTVWRENDECIIDEDCYFTIPEDFKNWKCIKDAGCGVYRNCSKTNKFCKRCPSGYYKDVPTSYATSTTTTTTPAVTTSTPLVNTIFNTASSEVTERTWESNVTTALPSADNSTESRFNESTVTDNVVIVNATNSDNIIATTVYDNLINETSVTVELNRTSMPNNATVFPPFFIRHDVARNNSLSDDDDDYNSLSSLNIEIVNNTSVLDSRNETRNEIN